MPAMKYVFGPVPSRRLGSSLGISPIPKRTCNYSCIYCQLGRTLHMTNTRQEFFCLEDILKEVDAYLQEELSFDVVTIVGEGEPTLYSRLGDLIDALHQRVDVPVAVITNGGLLYDASVREELMKADIVLPSLDAYCLDLYKKIDRPIGTLNLEASLRGLIQFSKDYKGQLYMEIMLVEGLNTSKKDLESMKEVLDRIEYDRVYINTVVRPPAESEVLPATQASIEQAVMCLGGISIDSLSTGSFFSEIEDPYEALLSIIARHPMNQFEIQSFLEGRNVTNGNEIFGRLDQDEKLLKKEYKGYSTYRIK